MSHNLRYALRMLARNPGFTAVAALTLALAIGANSAIFTVANALLLRPLPYADPSRLMLISATPADRPAEDGMISWPHFNRLRERNRLFAGMAACTFEVFSLTGRGDPEQMRSARVSWNFFQVLGVQPILGRPFLPEEDRPGAKDVVLLSYELWTRAFGGDRAAVGRSITLDSRDYTVIGVLPPKFTFPSIGTRVDIWAPRVFDLSLVTPARVNAGGPYYQVVGRLRPAASPGQAVSELQSIYREYRHDNPGNYDSSIDAQMRVRNLQEQFVANLRPAVLILSGAVALVLLIACANVASLLLASATGRRREFAARAALGAPARALVGLVLVEGLVLACLGGVLGLILGQAGLRVLTRLSETTYPQIAGVEMDWRVLLFTFAVSVGSGVCFGLAPALQLSRSDLFVALRNGGRAGNRGAHRARSLLVVAQVALSTILLVGSGLLLRSFVRLRSVNPGFDARNVLTMEITLPTGRYSRRPQLNAFYADLIRHVQTIPGVSAAALSTALPTVPTHLTPVLFEGQPPVVLGKRPIVHLEQISPDYASALGVPMLSGRSFDAHDDAQAPPVAIVNQTAVRRFWPNENPLGKRIYVGGLPDPFVVVGVFGDVRNSAIDVATDSEIYLPLPQYPWSLLYLSVRARMDVHGLIGSVRHELAAVDPEQPVASVQTGEELMERASAQPRFTTLLVGLFAGVAFLLAGIGLYGVISYSVTQRTQELGIRMALGATRARLLTLVIGEGLRLAVAGILIGAAASAWLTKFLQGLLFQTSSTDPSAFAAGAVLFTAAAGLASYIPASRATRIDPTEALRLQ